MRKLRTIKTRVHGQLISIKIHARTSHRFSLLYAVTINSDFHIVTLNISFRLFFNSDPTLHIQLTTLHVYVHYCIYTYIYAVSHCGLLRVHKE